MICVFSFSRSFFFFFKQKTAYEMRISHWSSDVCSSPTAASGRRPISPASRAASRRHRCRARRSTRSGMASSRGARASKIQPTRSEEHTSELQSLMRISYAVFCFKKKNQTLTQKDTSFIQHSYDLLFHNIHYK